MRIVNPMCGLIRRRLGAYHDGELAGAARRRIESHVSRCRGCAAELAEVERLHAALALDTPDPGQPVWDAFWPQVRARLAGPAEVEAGPAPAWWRAAAGRALARPRLVFGAAAAAAAVGLVAILAPWPDTVQQPVSLAPVATPGATETPVLAHVLIQSVETNDPQSSVMVFDSPESDMTVLWVFGLPPTDA
jgi:anti-sigma factor RsiW